MDNQFIFNPSSDFETFISNDLEDIISKAAEESKILLDSLYSGSLIHQVYRNFSKCREMKPQILAKI